MFLLSTHGTRDELGLSRDSRPGCASSALFSIDRMQIYGLVCHKFEELYHDQLNVSCTIPSHVRDTTATYLTLCKAFSGKAMKGVQLL